MNKRTKQSLLALLLVILVILISIIIGTQQTRLRAAQAECSELKSRLAFAESRLQVASVPLDWPYLRRYSEENASLQPPQKGEIAGSFFG